jgi:hypothetical protein
MASPGNSSLNVILDAGGNNRHFLQTNPVNWSIENITLMNGAVSTDNVGDNLGGSIYIAAPNQLLTLTSCIISNNIAYMGGAIGSIPGAEVVISACAIKNNHASKYGGAFAYVNTTLNASVVSGNISDENGGAAYSGNHQWINSLALGNTALDSGGVYLDGSHQWTNCRAYANSANYGGVGYGGELIASTSIIAFNHTNLSGTWTYSTTNILACTINNNTASQNGGVFYRGTHEIRNSLIFSNTAQGLGGVIAQGTITINNCIVSGNRAQRGGFAFQNTATVIVQTLLLNNMATVSGGVLFNGDNRLVNCTVVGNSPEAYYDSASGGGANGELDASNTLFVDSLAAASGSYLITVTLNNCLSSAALSNFVNASIGDYRLLPSSSGANAGDTAAWLAVSNNNPNDLGGSPRIVGGVIDIGAYESSSIATSNHAPSLTASSPQTFSEGQAVVLAWSTSDIDGDAVTVSISGWVTSNSYIASYTDSGNHTVYLNASDGHGGFASATINVIILNVNRAPSLNTASSVSFNEGQAVVLTWNVSDPDGDTVTVSISGWVTNNSYVATYTDSGNHTVYLNASDGRGGFATATINVIIKNINRAPSLNTSSTVSFNEGQAVVLTWNVSDPDGDTVTVSISGWITNNSYLASYTDSGNHTVYLNASDGHGGFASATINVVIRNVNRAPILSTSLTVNFNAGDPVILTWNASDPDGDSVTVSISGWITNNSYIAVLADSGNHTVYLTASDGRGGFASTSINILIRSVNHAPTINSVANISFNEGQAVILTWNVSDSDGDSVTVSISGWITNNNYIASFTDSGNHVVYLTASDGHGGFASATINISIINTPSDNIVRISQFYIAPNPYNAYFTGSNSILHLTYSLSCDAAVKIIVYNIAGRRIKDWNLTPGFEGSRFGKNHLQWDGLTGSGEKLSTGIYFVKIMATSSAGSDKSEFTIMVLK